MTNENGGVFRIGGRMGLELDAGWEQWAVFVIDRTEPLNAHDSDIGEFDW